MPKSQFFNLKTPAIVLAAIIALAVCIFVAIKLFSLTANVNEIETPRVQDQNETLILRAIDGDTLELASGEIIRLLCVDTPEEGEEGYEEAKGFLSSLIFSGEESLRIERQGTDNYNRTLAWIYSGSTLVSKEIIDNGYGSLFEYNGTDCAKVAR